MTLKPLNPGMDTVVEYLNPSAIANHQRPFRPYFELNLHRIKNVGIH